MAVSRHKATPSLHLDYQLSSYEMFTLQPNVFPLTLDSVYDVAIDSISDIFVRICFVLKKKLIICSYDNQKFEKNNVIILFFFSSLGNRNHGRPPISSVQEQLHFLGIQGRLSLCRYRHRRLPKVPLYTQIFFDSVYGLHHS